MPPITKNTKTQAQTWFLAALVQGYSITGAAKKAKISRRTFYAWRADDEEFAAEWDSARESTGDWYEDQNRKQAAKGNMPAITNGLKMHRRLVERQEVKAEVEVTVEHIDHRRTLLDRVSAVAARSGQDGGGVLPS